MQTFHELLTEGTQLLVSAGIEEARLDAWLLLEYTTGKSRAYYFAHGEECVTAESAKRYLELIGRRTELYPISAINRISSSVT